jgi:hypothetical protein
MNAIPDRVLIEERQYQRELEEDDAAWECLAPECLLEIREGIETDAPLMNELIRDGIASLTASEEVDLATYYQRDTLAFGALIERATEKQIDAYIASEQGQKLLADMVTRKRQELRE